MTYWAVFTAAFVLAEVLQAQASNGCKIPVTACTLPVQPLPFHRYVGLGSVVAETFTNFQCGHSARSLNNADLSTIKCNLPFSSWSKFCMQ